MYMVEYKHPFSLSTFIFHLYLPDDVLAKMFTDSLNPQFRGMVEVQSLRTLRDVVEVAIIVERKI